LTVSEIRVVDMHTGGEPLRIITSGYPTVIGSDILEKRAYLRDNLDHLRRMLMFEPRGHADMYGALLVPPSLPQADLAVLFMHNEGYSTMCGHAIIALGRYAVDKGLVKAQEPETKVVIECPCGLVDAFVAVANGKSGEVRFDSVPAFLHTEDVEVDIPGVGRVSCDIAYGGAFYALVDCAQLPGGLERPLRDLTDFAVTVSHAVRQKVRLEHPDSPDLAFLYGTILTDGHDGSGGTASRNLCVFADGQVDRSPTGSGVTARLAAAFAKGNVEAGQDRLFESITGSRFTGTVLRHARLGRFDAVIVRVGGRAHYTGEACFIVEEDDPLGQGFLLR
jgi:proline racemase